MEYGGDYQRFREKIATIWMAQDSPVAMVTGASPPGKSVMAKDVEEDMEWDYMTQERYKLQYEKCGRRGHTKDRCWSGKGKGGSSTSKGGLKEPRVVEMTPSGPGPTTAKETIDKSQSV